MYVWTGFIQTESCEAVSGSNPALVGFWTWGFDGYEFKAIQNQSSQLLSTQGSLLNRTLIPGLPNLTIIVPQTHL